MRIQCRPEGLGPSLPEANSGHPTAHPELRPSVSTFLSPGAALRGTAGQHPLPTPPSQAQLHTIFKAQQQLSSILEQRGVIRVQVERQTARVQVPGRLLLNTC